MKDCYNFLVSLLVIIAIKDSATKYLLVDIEGTERGKNLVLEISIFDKRL